MTQVEQTKMHPAAVMYANEEKAGKLSRREFLSRTTSLGLTATAAYGLLGLTSPVEAAAHAQQGGEVRIAAMLMRTDSKPQQTQVGPNSYHSAKTFST